MKVNLTKKHIADLDKAVKLLNAQAKEKVGTDKREVREVAISISDILVRHDNRLEKDY